MDKMLWISIILITAGVAMCVQPAESANYYAGIALGEESNAEREQPVYGIVGIEWGDIALHHSSDLVNHDSDGGMNTLVYNFSKSLRDGKWEVFTVQYGLGIHSNYLIDVDKSDLGYQPIGQLTVKYIVLPNIYMHWKQINGDGLNVGFGSVTMEF